MSNFNNKTLLVTGGTGSFGNVTVKKFLDSDIAEIRILSRDEKKQDDMRKKYSNPKLKFFIGDTKDPSSLRDSVAGADYIFHAAALKQVPSCEFHPMEAVKTNVLGTYNVLQAAIAEKVSKVVCLSTDKAVYPINSMGISKAMMERVAVAASRNAKNTIISGTRYGNVMASRGSVIPFFVKQIVNNQPITITNPDMTRFMMTLDDAVELVEYAFDNATPGEIYVQKSPAASISVLAQALTELLNVPNHPINIIGTRHGEKEYEVLLGREEMMAATDEGRFYCVKPDLRDLDYEKYISKGHPKDIALAGEYTSHNTERLDIDEMKTLLLKLPFISKYLSLGILDEDSQT